MLWSAIRISTAFIVRNFATHLAAFVPTEHIGFMHQAYTEKCNVSLSDFKRMYARCRQECFSFCVWNKHLKIGDGCCSCHSKWEAGAAATSAHTYLFRPTPSYQSPIWRTIFNPKYCMEITSRPHCCMHGRSMLTEFLHCSGMLWEWWG
jgi:hypothetical protein